MQFEERIGLAKIGCDTWVGGVMNNHICSDIKMRCYTTYSSAKLFAIISRFIQGSASKNGGVYIIKKKEIIII